MEKPDETMTCRNVEHAEVTVLSGRGKLGEGAETRAAQQPVCQAPPDRHARPTIPLVRSQCGRRGARSLEMRTCVHVWMVGRIRQ